MDARGPCFTRWRLCYLVNIVKRTYAGLTGLMPSPGRSFEGWQEGPLSFRPTFKFRRGTTQYHGDGGDEPAIPGGTAASPGGDQNADGVSRATTRDQRCIIPCGAAAGSPSFVNLIVLSEAAQAAVVAVSAPTTKPKGCQAAHNATTRGESGAARSSHAHTGGTTACRQQHPRRFLCRCRAQAAPQRQRTPAWTDRVLWRGDGLRLLSYASAELIASDHMPVAASFAVPVREYNRSAATVRHAS